MKLPPSQITVFTATAASSSQIDLDWDAPADGGSEITGYEIERRGATGPFTTISPDTWGTNTVYSDTGLDAETEYDYRISAINSIGIGSASSIVSETTQSGGGETAPSQITVFTATAASSSQIDLDWDAPADGGSEITGYEIERRGATGPFTTISPDTWGTNTVYSDTGLDAETEYDYRISAINSIGIGSASSIVSETTQSGGGDVADAGTDFSVVQNTPFVQLDGSGSTTPNTGYTWTNSHGIILSDPSIVNPTFTAPAHINGPPSGNQYTFTLTVTFSVSPDSVDTVTVTIDKK